MKKTALKGCTGEKHANDIRRLERPVEPVTHEVDGLWQKEQTDWKGSRDEVNKRTSDKMSKERKKNGSSGRQKMKEGVRKS